MCAAGILQTVTVDRVQPDSTYASLSPEPPPRALPPAIMYCTVVEVCCVG